MYTTIANIIIILAALGCSLGSGSRSKRYLLTPVNTQWGVFATVSIPLPDSTTSVAWFYEANYYSVANATYFEPLLGDVIISRDRTKRSNEHQQLLTRKLLYIFIESMLERHGFSGRACLLRAICESSTRHLLHNGVVGDLLHLVLTPSTSEPEEDIEDCFYEAEYWGELELCDYYLEDCPISPLELISIHVEDDINKL
ncbi:uncharacterized protein LOC105385430 [Plutella xylostella]|uniref:uncharacterized protein LOC105385430 n=1 Tax=Plutella xylostella TaxID=51655 RepID=UPI002032C44F|nr:uncharacterized protein LOC105385430 [Plutella xylostella]